MKPKYWFQEFTSVFSPLKDRRLALVASSIGRRSGPFFWTVGEAIRTGQDKARRIKFVAGVLELITPLLSTLE
jgi:hypothetical protein